MKPPHVVVASESLRGERVELANRWPRHSEESAIPKHWEIPFPQDQSLQVMVYQTRSARNFGIIVHHFNESEARFILRGDHEVGDDLVACLQTGEEFARLLGCQDLVTQEKINPDWLDAAKLFVQSGFVSLDESWIFQCPFEPFANRVNRIMEILMRNGAIPDEARTSDLNEGKSLARKLLADARLMDGFDFDHRLDGAATKPISAEHSKLVWVGSNLVGIILVAPTGDDGTYEIPVRYIIPSYRRTWVNAALIHSCVKNGENVAAATVRFNANSITHHETIHLAEQAGCVRIASVHRYGKRLL